MPTSTAEPEDRALSDETIIIPHKEVRLTNGRRVVVAPWGLTQGALVLARLDALTPKLFTPGETLNARQLLARAYGEVVDLVSMTVEIPREEMEKPPSEGGWTFEDLLGVTDAVLEVCILRSDGAGALPLLVGLVGKMTTIVSRSTGPELARLRLSGSEAGGTSPARSGNGLGSRRKKTARKKRPSSRKS